MNGITPMSGAVHELAAQSFLRRELVVRPAKQPHVLDARLSSLRDWPDVIKLDLIRGTTRSSARSDE